MAGDWIPIRVSLCDDPAVLQMAAALGVSEVAVVGGLVAIWGWVDQHGDVDDTRCTIRASRAFIDRRACQTGFTDAMIDAGWLIDAPGGVLEVPNWDRWFGRSARVRLRNTEKKRQARDKMGTERGQNGDKMGTKRGQIGVPQNRTEQNRIAREGVVPREVVSSSGGGAGGGRASRASRIPPDFEPDDKTRALAIERGIDITTELPAFIDYWAAIPGQRGLKLDWQGTLRNWIRRAKPSRTTPHLVTTDQPVTANGRMMAKFKAELAAKVEGGGS